MKKSEIIRKERIMRELSLRELSLLSGVTAAEICRIENGLSKPRPITIEKIKKAFQEIDRKKTL